MQLKSPTPPFLLCSSSSLSLSLHVAARPPLLVTRLFSRSPPGHGELLTFRRGAAPVPAKSPDVLRCLLMPARLPTMFDPPEGEDAEKEMGMQKRKDRTMDGVKEKVHQCGIDGGTRQGVKRIETGRVKDAKGTLFYVGNAEDFFKLKERLGLSFLLFLHDSYVLRVSISDWRMPIRKKKKKKEDGRNCTLGYW